MRVVALAVLAATLLLTMALPAAAHPIFTDSAADPGEDVRLTLTVPSEEPPDANVRIEITVASGFSNVACVSKAGWSCDVAGGRVIFERGTGLDVIINDSYSFAARTPAQGGSYVFPVIQTYRTGLQVRWTDSSQDAERPAARLMVTGPTASPSPTPTVTPSPTTSSPSPTTSPSPTESPSPTTSPSPSPTTSPTPTATPGPTTAPPTTPAPPGLVIGPPATGTGTPLPREESPPAEPTENLEAPQPVPAPSPESTPLVQLSPAPRFTPRPSSGVAVETEDDNGSRTVIVVAALGSAALAGIGLYVTRFRKDDDED